MSTPPALAEILDKISDGISVLSGDGEAVFVNEKSAEIFLTADDRFRNRITEAIDERSAVRFEHFHAALNRWFEHRAFPNQDGSVTLISYDITPRRRIEEALRASEERFRRLIESNIIGVLLVVDGFITEANSIFLQMVKYDRADLAAGNLRWREMTPSRFDALDLRARMELETNGFFTPYEKELFCKDGSLVPVLIGGVEMPAQGESRETMCLALDLTERRRADDRVRSIVEAGKILASSLECENTLPEFAEFVASKLAGSCTIYVREDGRKVRMADAHTVPYVTEGNLEQEVNRVIADGQPVIMAASVSRMLLPVTFNGEIYGVLVLSSSRPFDRDDIHLFEVLSRRVGLALENARLYRETQNANRLKDEFVAVISHELRTPLTPILGGVYMMRNEPHDPKIVEFALDLIERNAKTQVKIVDDLLDVSRAMTGKLRLNMQPVDLPRVIHSAVETVRPASEAKRILIDVQIGPFDAAVSGDPDRLQQVVWNLLTNSVKFTPRSGRVTVELAQAPGHAEIRVTDTGIGIEAEFLPHVFDKFRQADTSRTRTSGGMGLGLAIVRHLVESHGGTVFAHSSGDEQGSTFIVRLPLRPQARFAAF